MQISVQKLKQLRESRAWTQSHLAEVADISLRTVQRIEKSGFASPESVKAICSAFGKTVDDIIEAKQSNESDAEGTITSVKNRIFNPNVVVPSLAAFFVAFALSYYLNI